MARDVRVSIFITAKNLAQKAFLSLEGGLKRVANAAKIATAAAVALGAAFAFKAAKSAASFQTVMAQVSTLMGSNVAPAFQNAEQRILSMSKSLPQSADELGVGLYDVVSAGVEKSSKAFEVLEVSAKAAVAGGFGVTSQDAVRTITGLLNAYQLDASEASRVSDILFGTIKEGVVTFADLSQNMGEAATSAALAGVDLEELGAAMATMTKFGVSAAESTTSLNRLFLTLAKQSPQQKKALEDLGVEFNLAAVESKGLVGVLQDLEDATGGNLDQLAEAFPEIRALRAAMVIAGDGSDEFRRILNELRDSTGAAEEAFQKMSETAENQWKLFKNQVNVALIELGSEILPAVTTALTTFGQFLDDVFDPGRVEEFRDAMSTLGPEATATNLELARIEKEGIDRALKAAQRRLEEGPGAGATAAGVARAALGLGPGEAALERAGNIAEVNRLQKEQQEVNERINALEARRAELIDENREEEVKAADATLRTQFAIREVQKAMQDRAVLIEQLKEATEDQVSTSGLETVEQRRLRELVAEQLEDEQTLAELQRQQVETAKERREEAERRATAEVIPAAPGAIEVGDPTDFEAERQERIRELMFETGDALALANRMFHATGDELEFINAKSGALEERLMGLLENGVDPESEAIRELVRQIRELSDERDRHNEKIREQKDAERELAEQQRESARRSFAAANAMKSAGREVGGLGGAFASAAGNVAQAIEAGEEGAGAFADAAITGLGAIAGNKQIFYLAEAAAALARGFLGDPKAFVAAAQYGIAAALMGSLGDGGGGGGAGGGGVGGLGGQQRSQIGTGGDRGTAILKIEGGFLDMSDPRQEESFRNAIEEISGRRVITQIGG